MARKTKKQKQKEKKIALVLVGVLLLAVLTAAAMASPGFAAWLFRITGIEQHTGPPNAGRETPIAVHIIDVGQGDAVLLCADGEYALIDAGPPEAADALVSYLRAAGVNELRYMFMTHPHADHIGGMQKVAEQIKINTMVLPDLSLAPYPTTSLFENLLETLLYKQITAKQAAMGEEYPLGSGGVCVVHAGIATDDNYNLLSLGLLFNAGGMRFLNTGDAEKTNEAAMLEDGADVKADVFMAGHHGSSTSNTKDFLQVVNPNIVAISCAAGNSYGHPHNSALDAYELVQGRVLRTDKDGSILLWPENGTILYAVGKNRG